MGYSIVGIIEDGCWRVAEFCNDIKDLQAFYKKCFEPFIKNKKIIKQNICRCKFVGTKEALVFTEESVIGVIGSSVIGEIAKLEDGKELELIDARKMLDDEVMCDIGYIFNFDSNTLTCYHNGKRFMFGRFEFSEINNAKKFRKVEAAYEMSQADNEKELDEIGLKGSVEAARKLAIALGMDPEEGVRKFLEGVNGARNKE